MLRNRFPRFPQKGGRNLQNLHVIPTASVTNLKLLQPEPTVIQITPTDVVNVSNQGFFNQNKIINSYKNQRRNRRRKRAGKNFPVNQSFAGSGNCNFSKPNSMEFAKQAEKVEPKNVLKNVEPKKELEKMELKKESKKAEPKKEPERGKFKKEADKIETKKEPERRSKRDDINIKSLKESEKERSKKIITENMESKKEPKRMELKKGQERIESKVDAEKTESISDTPGEDNYFEEVEVASVEGEPKQGVLVRFRKSKHYYLKKYKYGYFKPQIYEFSDPTFVNVNVQGEVDVDVVSEAEYDYETDNLDHGDSHEMLNIVEVDDSDEDVEMVEDDSNGKLNSEDNAEVKDKPLLDVKTASESIHRTYKTCIKGNKDFTQGKSLIQCSLDSYKSHLIGLEYVVEVQDSKKSSVFKYSCLLCCEDLKAQEFPDKGVIAHINSYKHIVRYLERHFPGCGYKFEEKCEYNIALLQKLSEEINQNMGYYFMCITSKEYFVKNGQNVKDIIENAYHPNENDLTLDKSLFVKKDNSNFEEIKSCVTDIISKVSLDVEVDLNKKMPESVSVPVKNDDKDKKNLNDNVTVKSMGKKPRDPSSFKTYKGSTPLSAYMKLRTFASAAFRKLPKRKPNTTEEVAAEKKNVEKKQSIENELPKTAISNTLESDIYEIDKTECNVTGTKTVETIVIDSEENGNDVVETIVIESQKIGIGEIENNVIAASEEAKSDVKANAFESEETGADIIETIVIDSDENETEDIPPDLISSSVIVSGTSPKIHRTKGKVLPKSSTIHSKYCRKRILGKESSRSRLAVKTSVKDEFASGVSDKCNVNYKSVTKSVNLDASEKIIKVKEESKHAKTVKSSSQKSVPLQKNLPASKISTESRPSTSKLHHRIPKKDSEKSSEKANVGRDSPSLWRPLARTSSPLKASTIESTYLTSKKQSKSPVRKYVRRHSKSPTKRIKSPLRIEARPPFISSAGSYSRSPSRKRSSPFRRKSRSPVKRKSRSPIRRKSRSPLRRHSRSPVNRRSRSPLRRNSRSPFRRHSRSPGRRRSRSPLRHRTRSPLRRQSRSPLRRYSRSPLRRRSRSPMRQRSRSPYRQHSRSPLRHLSRSPLRRHSRSPLRRRSRSPVRRHSRSPFTFSPYRSLRRRRSPDFERSSSIHERFNSEDRFLNSLYEYEKHLGSMSEFSKVRETSKALSSSKRNTLDKFKSQPLPHTSSRGISDLDPVSDEDESIYFNDKHQRPDDVNAPLSPKMMLSKFLQKVSMADANSNDPALNKLMQFMEAHSDEIKDLMGPQSKPNTANVAELGSNMQERSMILQQYLLSNLAGSNMEPRFPPPVVNAPAKFTQPPYVQAHPGFGHPTNIPPPTVSQPIQQRFFPPNVSVPPPQLYQVNQPHQEFPPKPNVPPEVMFKDLKATVNKLFGANEGAIKIEKPQMPGYVTEPDPEKWDLSHPDTPKFNAPVGSKNIFHQGKNVEFSHMPQNPVIREDTIFNNNNPQSGQFFGGRNINRPQVPSVPVPPPDAKVSFCEVSRNMPKGNLFPVVNPHMNKNFSASSSRSGVNDVKVSLAQRLASVLVKVGMIDVPAPLLQEMLMKIGAFSSSPRQDISEAEILSILKKLGYLP